MQFGAGPQFAAQCPPVSPPEGWRPWADADGPIPHALQARAADLAAQAEIGAAEHFQLPGVVTLIRVEPRAWKRDENGTVVQGCFQTGVVYLPAPTEVIIPPEKGGLTRLEIAVAVLTVVSLGVGIAATISSWGKR